MKLSINLLLALFLPLIIFAQQKIEHQVKPKETLYSITKKYNISADELKKLNPIIEKEGLKPDQILVIKEGKTVKNSTVQSAKSTKYKYVKIEPKQTLYGLSKKYNLSEEELIKLNPSLKNGLKIGDSIKISYKADYQQKSLVQTVIQKPIDKNLLKDIHIVMMLPFQPNENKEALQKLSTDFLIGSKFAIDSLAKQGKNIHLKVFDTKNDEETIKNFLNEYDFGTVDAVIGPIFKSQIELVANKIKKKIPIVSPIASSESLLDYSNLILTEPSMENVADKIIDELTKAYTDEKIFILTTEKEKKLANYTKTKFEELLPNASVEIIFDTAQFPSGDVLVSLAENKTAFTTILASDDSDLGEKYLNYLYGDLFEKDIKNFKSFGIGYIPIYDKKISQLKSIGFTYSLAHRVNIYGADEKELIKKIKKSCCQETSKYMEIGFDVTYDIIDRMNAQGELWNKLEGSFVRFSTKFDYQQTKNAFVNKGVRLIKLFETNSEKNN